MTPGTPAPMTMHEAVCSTDGSGAVFPGKVLTEAQAIVQRGWGGDVVVCGIDTHRNALQARKIELAVGPCLHHGPHEEQAGPQALAHFQQRSGQPPGHTFYESAAHKVGTRT